MTVDSLVQIIALLIAIFALAPRIRQLELRIQIGVYEIFVSLLYFYVVLFLLFYDIFLKIGLAPEWKLENLIGLTPSLAAFPISLLFVLFLAWRLRLNRLPRRSIFKFQELAEELLQRGEYPELISLLDRYWDSLIKIEHNNFWILKINYKLDKFIEKTSPEHALTTFLRNLTSDELRKLTNGEHIKKQKISLRTKLRNYINKLLRALITWILKILPDYQDTSETARELLRVIFSNDDFIDSLSKIRPYFALDLLRTIDFPRRRPFFENYLKCMLRNSKSVLYYEISRMFDSPGKYDQEIPKSLRLLRYLLNDANEAEKMALWKPIGDEVIRHLEDLSTNSNDPYNLPINDSGGKDDNLVGSPIHLGIQFFDVMVGRAIHQGIKWHMWLYYFPQFTERILDNYKPHASVNLNAEWPTRYSKFLYMIITTQEDWMGELERLPSEKLSDWVVNNVSNLHENDNIPKSNLIALGFSLEKILFSNNISDRFKDYLVDIVFHLYLKLATTPSLKGYSEILLSILRSEGIFDRKDLKSKLKESFRRIDQIPFMMQVNDFYEEFS